MNIKPARRRPRVGLEQLESREVPAAIGTLDQTFSPSGVLGVTSVVSGNEFRGVAVQRDGKIVAVGGPAGLTGPDFYITRFNPDGSLDTTFGTAGTGVVTVDVGGAGQIDNANAVAIDRLDRIVVIGSGGAVVPDFALVCLSPDGKSVVLNKHFHIGNPADANAARGVAIQNLGSNLNAIVIAGDAKVGGDRDFAFIRVDPTTGALLGTAQTSDFPAAGDDETGNAVAIDPTTDKIVLVGTTSSAGATDIAIIRRNADGSVDGTFNNAAGQKQINVSGNDAARGAVVTPTGSIIVTGNNGAADADTVVAQLLSTGGFDPAFNGGAIKTITRAGNDFNRAVARQVDGRIVVVGDAGLDVGLFRLTADGKLDTSFNATGDATFNVNGNDDGNAVAIDPNGRIVIAGDDAASAGFVGRVIGTVEKGQLLTVGGPLFPSAFLYKPDFATGQYKGSLSYDSPFGNVAVNIRTAVGDVNGDGVPDFVTVTGPGTPIRLAVTNGATINSFQQFELVAPFDPFGGDFTGGGFVAVGDFDHDGHADFAVSPDQGGGPRVTIFSLIDGVRVLKQNFFGIDDPDFRGGARVAIGDINGDATPDLAVAAGFLGGPRTAIFDGKTVFATPTRLIGDFFAFPGTDAVTLRNGVYVSIGDVDGDGFADLVFGGGPGGAPRVFVLSGALVSANNVAGAQANPIANFFVAGNASDRGGVRVASTDADGDNKAEVVVGSGRPQPNPVRVYLGKNFSGVGEPTTFQDDLLGPNTIPPLPDGVFVG
ncbi:MAG: FG-GAP-like repeat-containing protein [Gemmataceae bacterium]